MAVASRLRQSLFKCYFKHIRNLKRLLTFREVDERLEALEGEIYKNAYGAPDEPTLSQEDFSARLQEIRALLCSLHDGLFVEDLDRFIQSVKLFGYHFASLDIRQDSRILHKVLETLSQRPEVKRQLSQDFASLSESARIDQLMQLKGPLSNGELDGAHTRDALGSMRAIRTIQRKNGERGANRFIISNSRGAYNLAETYALFLLSGWEAEDLRVEIIPLFESITDLQNAAQEMEKMYAHPVYKRHLLRRGGKQTIMLGFSDGTKDGGYLMANWSIYKAKARITAVSRKHGIKVIFFDGRGGPPARGGGKTHKFYSSLGKRIENREIQLTVQGQTISSKFGTPQAARYNLEQLLTAGIKNELYEREQATLSKRDEQTLADLAQISYAHYCALKEHEKFVPYLEKMSTLKYYGAANISSRPSKRGPSGTFAFEDLRAIPFVGSWSQLRQNVPGFFGLGTALKTYEKRGDFKVLKDLYRQAPLFRILLENTMMSLTKSFFPLTKYMERDPDFGAFWTELYEEYRSTRAMLLKVSGCRELMENQLEGKRSIALRERIVLPLITIQQYALQRIAALEKQADKDEAQLETYRKIVTRSLYGNINASRNSV